MTKNLEEEMNRRIESGEFGNPPNIKLVTAVMQEMHEMEVGKNTPTYHNISGLWAEHKSPKVAFSGRVQEDVHIPAGTKLLCFRRESDNDRAPDLGLVYVTYDD
jgi:hypothetical protein